MSRESRAEGASPPEAAKPGPRRSRTEEKLRRAIREKHLVTLRCAGDPADRTFAPHGIYVSPDGEYCVAGLQLADSGRPREAAKATRFALAKIEALQLTDTPFAADARFDPREPEYRNGIVQWIRSG